MIYPSYHSGLLRKQFCTYVRVAVLPKSKEEVAKVVRYCYSNDLSVVPQGGNTGLVGGSVAMSESSVVVSMSKMNAIE